MLTLTGNLDPEQRKRLLEIADKCPVHRTLTSEIDIRTVEHNGWSSSEVGAYFELKCSAPSQSAGGGFARKRMQRAI